ncbi:MAG: insulinase family protein, partial [Sphingobacteriales bacterium]
DTKNYTAEDFSNELDKLGSSISVYTTDDATVVNVQSLKKNLDRTVKLLEERLLNPKFTEEALAMNKKRAIESIKNAMNRPNYVASTVYPKILYGADNVLGWSASGTEKTINNIELKDIEAYYSKFISRKDAQLVIVGDMEKDAMVSKFAFLSRLPAHDVTLPDMKAAPKTGKTKIYFVNVPNAAQTEFRVGYVTDLKYDALGDYYKAGIMNYPLGGAFNSRLNLDLREAKGWTYGARGSFDADKYTGAYSFSAGIRADATDSALVDIMQIMKEFKGSGVKKDELEFTRMSLGQSDARKYEGAFQKASFLSRILEYNLNADYTKQQNALLSKLDLREVNSIVKKYAPDVDKINILLVGDKEKVWQKLTTLGYEIEELDRDGNPVAKP